MNTGGSENNCSRAKKALEDNIVFDNLNSAPITTPASQEYTKRMDNLECCIHCSNDLTTVNKFTEDTLSKCRLSLKVRQYHNFKHSNFVLPLSVNELKGAHKKCYSNFTAIKSKHITSVPEGWLNLPTAGSTKDAVFDSKVTEPTTSKPSTRSNKPCVSSKNCRGVLDKKCIFCKKPRRIFKRIEQTLLKCATKTFECKVRSAAEQLQDYGLIASIVGSDMVAKEVHYHGICRREYCNQARKTQQTNKTNWHKMRELHCNAFEVICNFIKNKVINGNNVVTLGELYKMYMEAMRELDGNLNLIKFKRAYPPAKLEFKVMNYFLDTLAVDKGDKEPLFFKPSLNLLPSLRQQKLTEMKQQSLLRDAAYHLRKEIQSIENNSLPEELRLSDVLKGECQVPDSIKEFIGNIIEGPAKTNETSNVTKCKISSISEDLIYNVTKGKIKPKKHINLGLSMKSLTGSRKVINILNRYGHTVSYSVAEEIETELAYSSIKQSALLPDGFLAASDLCTSVAFNNFDKYVETLTGKNTMHDTVGIIYQNYLHQSIEDQPIQSLQVQLNVDEPENSPKYILQSDIGNQCNASNANEDISKFERNMQDGTCMKSDDALSEEPGSSINKNKGKKRRRSFEEVICDIEPFMKKPKREFEVLSKASYPNLVKKDYRIVDLIWQMSIAHEISTIPMWVGYNSMIFEDDLPIQNLAYLPQICASPTSYSTVQCTLKMAQQVAEECGQTNIMCTYDLNIAKMALEIQNEMKPQFDNVFIMFGPFHIQLAFFKALGKIIDGSGISDVLSEANLIAHGSLNGLIGGTHYNRCRRIYPMLGVALRILHYQSFMKELPEDEVPACLLDILIHFSQTKQNSPNEIDVNEILMKYIDRYRLHEQETRNGKHGATAKFWIFILDLIDLYHDFERSVRMGDINLFMNSIKVYTDLFFIMNHHNYARWLVVFYDKLNSLLNQCVDDPTNCVMQQLKKGLFSIRRTKKNFSRTGVDLTLEQTINADAANKLTGVTSFQNSITARQRWAITHSQRTSIISNVLQSTGIMKTDDVTKETSKARMKSDNAAVKKLVECLSNTINPFSQDLDSNFIFNISSGKAMSIETTQFLNSIDEKGRTLHENFRTKCLCDKSMFSKPISRNALQTFMSESTLKLKKSGTITEIKVERDFFGRLLALSLSNNLNMQAILEYPLFPIPLSLCHIDGNIRKNQKSDLMKALETMVHHEEPNRIDEIIIDGFCFLHRLINVPATFGGLAKHILQNLEKLKCKKIHLVFDQYITPSIKDIERNYRAGDTNRHQDFHISGQLQSMPQNFIKTLRNDVFKDALVGFLVSVWQNEDFNVYFQSFNLYVTHRNECYYYQYSIGEPVRCTVPYLSSSHVEADSKIVYHLSRVHDGNVVIDTADTDVLVILIGNIHIIPKGVKVWIKTGKSYNNTLRYIDVLAITNKIGLQMCLALPAFHSLTGCDYTASFFKLGKVRPFKELLKSKETQKTLAGFQEGETISENEYQVIESFICRLYKKKKYY